MLDDVENSLGYLVQNVVFNSVNDVESGAPNEKILDKYFKRHFLLS